MIRCQIKKNSKKIIKIKRKKIFNFFFNIFFINIFSFKVNFLKQIQRKISNNEKVKYYYK